MSVRAMCRIIRAVKELRGEWRRAEAHALAEDAEAVEAIAAYTDIAPHLVRTCLLHMRQGVSFSKIEEVGGVDEVSLAMYEAAEAEREREAHNAALPEMLAQLVVLLPREQAQLIAMRYGLLGYEEHSTEAVAAARGGQRPEQVRAVLNRAHAALAALLERNRDTLIERTDDAALRALLSRPLASSAA